MGPLLLVVLLRLLMVAMSLGWGRGLGRSGSALERMLRSKDSEKESCVEASLNATLRCVTWEEASRRMVGLGCTVCVFASRTGQTSVWRRQVPKCLCAATAWRQLKTVKVQRTEPVAVAWADSAM